MTRQEFRKWLEEQPVILDGATGTNLQKAGMPTGVCPEAWIMEHRQVLMDLQRAYVDAGSNIVYAPTFSGNRIKLEEYGIGDQLEKINRELVQLSREAVAGKALVAGNLTMTGEQLYPMGKMPFEELVDIYKEQARCIVDAGADLFVVETMMSLAETRAAVIAVREICDLPVVASMTYNEDGRTLYGTDPTTAVVVLQSLGADAIGVNCSTGPEQMVPIVEEMRKVAEVPLLAKPNAGLPELIDGETVYLMRPEEFAKAGRMLVQAGAHMVGGCCGTTPEHIRALSREVKGMSPLPVEKHHKSLLTSERKTLEIDIDGPFLVIGERINPTGKKKLQEELRQGRLDMVMDMAENQEESGAHILDINMGMNGIDEKEMLLEVVAQVGQSVNLPLCIDSSHVDVIEAALRQYPGRALINSISLEQEKFEKLLPIAKKYGAMFILLPLSDEGLPKDLEEKKQIIHKILDRALELGMEKEDIIVDGLVATVGANPMAAVETLETIRYCREELHLLTSCGLSNISFGLPNRITVNTAFLTMAIQSGLTMAIANPSQDMLMNAAAATDLLLNKKGADLTYINRMNELAQKEEAMRAAGLLPAAGTAATAVPLTAVQGTTGAGNQPKVFQAVLKGNKDRIVDYVKEEIAEGTKPDDVINDFLIPAINEVGDLFNRKKYFLPQLIASAETMKLAIEYLEPMLERKGDGENMPTLVIATVEGDIHDIGKNLVVLMLKNYGYHVIDMGKDVPKEEIIAKAKEVNADFIGLSALMTTTMMRMKEVVEAVKKENLPLKVIIGGAVITQSFADEIGADGYSKDAADCVKLVQRLWEEGK
ncbi:MAG: homocysteine S-methyltransferase family protein [Lachnospiraceae bacterium]|nr:homocysteine S-methyltransferase family protein [Lachnospiraceae bacterium]